LVFETVIIDRVWDGSYNGRPVETATYFYHLKYTGLIAGKVYEEKGDVMVVR